jgi:hypothetical protein
MPNHKMITAAERRTKTAIPLRRPLQFIPVRYRPSPTVRELGNAPPTPRGPRRHLASADEE